MPLSDGEQVILGKLADAALHQARTNAEQSVTTMKIVTILERIDEHLNHQDDERERAIGVLSETVTRAFTAVSANIEQKHLENEHAKVAFLSSSRTCASGSPSACSSQRSRVARTYGRRSRRSQRAGAHNHRRERMEAVLTQILTFVHSLFGKSALIYGFGWLFKLNPKFKDAGIPIATLVVNVLSTILAAAAEAAGAANHPAMFAVVQAVNPAPGAGVDVVFDVILPQLIADGAYNWPRRVWAWIKARLGR
jgi:hypothetical protein